MKKRPEVFGSHALRQSASAYGGLEKSSAVSDGQPAASEPKVAPVQVHGKLLWTFREFGQRIGVSERAAHDVVKKLGLVPRQLSIRCVRLIPAECEAALANLPRREDPQTPHQLLKGKVAALKKRGGTTASATGI